MAFVPKLGKRVRGALYVHRDAVDLLEVEGREAVRKAEVAVLDAAWNVARLGPTAVALLEYENIDASPFPRLLASALVDLTTLEVKRRSFRQAANPLILHRKELLFPPEDPRRAEWAALTLSLEAQGLFSDPIRIGRERQWLALLAGAGFDASGRPL